MSPRPPCLRSLCRVLVASALTLLPVLGWGYDVIMDKSGSMAGFANAGTAWSNFIRDLETAAGSRYAFGDDVRGPLPAGTSLLTIRLDDGLTKLDTAMARWLNDTGPGASAVIITDNVVDYQSASSTAAQQRFYRNFTGPQAPVTHLGIVVLRLPFNGRIYPLEKTTARRASDKPHYEGQRALVLYVFARDDAAAFNDLMTRVQTILRGLGLTQRVIRVKPFDRTALSSRGPGRNSPIQTPEHLKNKLRLSDGIVWMRGLAVGDEVRFPLEVVISSESPFVLHDVHAEAQIDFPDPKGMIRPSAFTFTVDPPTADVAPGTARTFTILVNGSGFLLPRETGLLDRARLTLRNAESLAGELNIRFTANLNNLDLSQGLLAEWNHERPEALGDGQDADAHARVYMLKPLVLDLLPTETARVEELLHERLGVRIDLGYPIGPLIGALIALCAVIAIAFFLVRWLLKRRNFVLSDEYGTERRFAPRLFGQTPVYANEQEGGELVFSLLYLFVGFMVINGQHYRNISGRWLDAQRGIVKMQHRNADDYDVRVWDLRLAAAPAPRRPTAPGENDWAY